MLTLLLATTPARAESEANMSFDGIVKMVRMDEVVAQGQNTRQTDRIAVLR